MTKERKPKPADQPGSVEGTKREQKKEPLEGLSGMEPGADVNEIADEPRGPKDYFEEDNGRAPDASFEDAAESPLEPHEDKGDRDSE